MKLFISNLPHSLTETELKAALAAYGSVEFIQLPRGQGSAANRGFAFAGLDSLLDDAALLLRLNKLSLFGRTIKAETAVEQT